MPSLISNLHIIQADMLRLCCGLVFIGLAVAMQTAWAAEGLFASEVDILTIQSMRSDAGQIFPYRLDASVAFARPVEAAPVSSVFKSVPRLHFVAGSKQETFGPTKTRWQDIPDSERVSVLPLLRFESGRERIEIRPQPHAIWFVWRKALP